MNVLLDTDVLIDVALERPPFVEHSARLLDLAERRLFQAYVAWHSIANFHYLVTGSDSEKSTRDFIVDLLTFVKVAPTTTKDVLYAARLDLPDFEDALQVAAARCCGAETIVTRNLKHYKRSPIPACTPRTFLRSKRYGVG